MPIIPRSILFVCLQLAQNVYHSMRFLILEIAKNHMERDLANKGEEGVVTLEFDFWPETA